MTTSPAPQKSSDPAALLKNVVEQVELRIDRAHLETWFRGLRVTRTGDGAVEFVAPSTFVRQWLSRHYLARLREAVIASLPGDEPSTVRITTRDRDASRDVLASLAWPAPSEVLDHTPSRGQERRIGSALREAVENFDQAGPAPCAPPFPGSPARLHSSAAHLNPHYTFDNFVRGPCNDLAHSAALAVTSNPGWSFNPFFVQGSVGLGKTHLIQAICHQITRDRPEARVLYMSCEEFTNEFIRAVREHRIEEFRASLRTTDVLAIDDVQFLADKQRTQEEFFHTFNALYNAQKQIVLSSDRKPGDIPSLEERLVSRFNWGFEADMQAPSFETRVAIVQRKARMRNVELPDEIAHMIAELVDTNIRELEGAVIKVIGVATITQRPVSTDLAKEALRGFGGTSASPVSPQRIFDVVSKEFSLSVKDLRGKCRVQAVTLPRHLAMYLIRQNTEHSYEEIGRMFGNRDHSSVIYGVRRIKRLISKDRMIDDLVNRLSALLRSS